jgi:hypothetical protein
VSLRAFHSGLPVKIKGQMMLITVMIKSIEKAYWSQFTNSMSFQKTKCFTVFLHQFTYKLTFNSLQLVLNVSPVSVYYNSTLCIHFLITNFTSIRQNFTKMVNCDALLYFIKCLSITLKFFKTVTQLNIQWMVGDYILVKCWNTYIT